MEIEENHRILIIDDNQAIHDDFRKIINKNFEDNESIDKLKSLIFEEAPSTVKEVKYEIDSAYQGKEGLEKVQQALDQGRPYAMAFVDVLMPPGWDGVETIKQIWKIDSEIQIAICTAYNYYSWEDLTRELGFSDGLLILKKPFDGIEVRQIACCLVKKWNLNQQIGHQFDKMNILFQEQAKQYDQLYNFFKETKET